LVVKQQLDFVARGYSKGVLRTKLQWVSSEDATDNVRSLMPQHEKANELLAHEKTIWYEVRICPYARKNMLKKVNHLNMFIWVFYGYNMDIFICIVE
jgi:hypothetical protein